MNAYDFDKTLYPGDSTLDFYLWCVRRYPAALLPLPRTAFCILFPRGEDRRTAGKRALFRFLRLIPDPERAAEEFWAQNVSRIYPWYAERRREDDVIVTASPEFEVAAACRLLGVRCIGTRVDPATGVISGINCRGAEKPRRFAELFDLSELEDFASDSLSDLPMLSLARRAYLVRNGQLVPYSARKKDETHESP